MARSLLNHSVLIALGLGLAGAIGCSGSGTSGTGTTGSAGTGGGSGGSGGATTSTATSTASSTSSASSSASTTGSGGSGGLGGAGGNGTASSSAGTGGMGTGGMGTSSGTGGDPNDVDLDGDGWSVNEGDCCDTPGNCDKPVLVNPGAFEYLGNGVDDDCDPATLDNVVPPECTAPALTVPTSGADLIAAMDLCQTTKEIEPKPTRKWGVISSSLLLADGTSTMTLPKDLQAGVLANYGTNVTPRKGTTMAAISSGTARDANDPGYVHPQNGTLVGQNGNYNANSQVGVPGPWLAAHNGVVPSPGNCPVCSGANCAQAFDSVNLKARIRVPTNARSFSYSFKFYTAEYPEFVCQQYNDFFITLLNSSWTPNPVALPCMSGSECESGTCNANSTCAIALPLPLDKNISFDAQKNAVSVNNGFFEVCFPAVNAPAGACPSGTLDLAGTGMGGWGANLKDGGGTEWLINDAPVVPGETMEIQFVTWDAGDHNVDSLVLLDKFRWNVTPSAPGVHK